MMKSALGITCGAPVALISVVQMCVLFRIAHGIKQRASLWNSILKQLICYYYVRDLNFLFTAAKRLHIVPVLIESNQIGFWNAMKFKEINRQRYLSNTPLLKWIKLLAYSSTFLAGAYSVYFQYVAVLFYFHSFFEIMGLHRGGKLKSNSFEIDFNCQKRGQSGNWDILRLW